MTSYPTAVFIGQSPIDIVARVDDAFLNRHGIMKQSMRIISPEMSDMFRKELPHVKLYPGGGAANAACAFQRMGGQATYNGKVADDEFGHLFVESLRYAGVGFINELLHPFKPSDHIYIFVTDDNERSFGPCYGISSQISLDDLNTESIREADLVFLEGFLLNNEGGYQTLLSAAKLARDHNTKTAFCPSDPSVISQHQDKIHNLFEYIDILILNEIEASALYPGLPLEITLNNITAQFEAGALTLGPDGAFGYKDKQIGRIAGPKISQNDIVNTNGAGDAFAGGFLCAYLKQGDIQYSLKKGQSHAIEVLKKEAAR